MSDTTQLHGMALIPVVELDPGVFCTKARATPTGSQKEAPTAWEEYWRASLADGDLVGLNPIYPGSWHVATSQFSHPQLESYLRAIVTDWGGVASLSDPDLSPILDGGFVLQSAEHGIVVEPTCCSDLSTIRSWHEAAQYEKDEWMMVWIGHPWVSVRFAKPWLLLSAEHESDAPIERWAMRPDELTAALVTAEAELVRFSEQISSILTTWQFEGDAAQVASQLAGCDIQ